jgi:hypothetical protein
MEMTMMRVKGRAVMAKGGVVVRGGVMMRARSKVTTCWWEVCQ